MRHHAAMRQMTRHARHAITAVLVVCGLLGAARASAQGDRRGIYAGIDLGIAHAAPLDSSVSAVTTPTKCDSLLYPDPAMAPRDAECTDTTPRALSSTGFAPGAGFAGGFSAGYAFDTLRVEFEYRVRAHGDDVSSILESSTNDAVVSKALEWSPVYPPTESVSDYLVQQFFANVYYDFVNASRWTPYVGAGGGLARTNLHYNRRLLRKTLAQGYQDVDPPLTLADRPERAAGTISVLEPTLTGNLVGFQVLAGVDYAVGERTSIGLKANWARFGDLKDDVEWSVIRSHAPVRADGVTPFTGELTFEGVGYWALTLGMKYRF